MKRLCLLMFISLAFIVPSVGFAQGTETLEPAEYKAPEVGTRIEYSNWTCTVSVIKVLETAERLQ